LTLLTSGEAAGLPKDHPVPAPRGEIGSGSRQFIQSAAPATPTSPPRGYTIRLSGLRNMTFPGAAANRTFEVMTTARTV